MTKLAIPSPVITTIPVHGSEKYFLSEEYTVLEEIMQIM